MEFPNSGVRAVLHSNDWNCTTNERVNIEWVACKPSEQCVPEDDFSKRIVCPNGTLDQFLGEYFRANQNIAVFQWFLESNCVGASGLEVVVANGICNQGYFMVDYVSDTQVRYRRFASFNCIGEPVFDFTYSVADTQDTRCVRGDSFSLTLYSASWMSSTTPPPANTPSETTRADPATTMTPPAADSNASSRNTLNVAMGVLAAALLVAVALVIFVWRKYRSRDAQRQQQSTLQEPLVEGASNNTKSSGTKSTGRGSDDANATSAAVDLDDELVNDFIDSSQEYSSLEASGVLSRRVAVHDLFFIRQLGVGGHAVVWLVLYQKTKLLASKRLLARDDPQQQKHFIDEICLSASLDHPQVVQFCGVAWTRRTDLQALFEFMEGGDLRSWLERTQTSAEHAWTETKLQLAMDVANALIYVHSRQPPIVHRDLKSRNVLLTESMRAKVCDFGSSRPVTGENTMTAGVGTMQWMAPEVICGERLYDQRADIYSFGVLLAEMDSHAVPYVNERNASGIKLSRMELLNLIASGDLAPSFSATCPATILTLTRQCLNVDPTQRPSAEEAYRALDGVMDELHSGTETVFV